MRVLLVNSSRRMRGGENQTLELGSGLLERGAEVAFAVRKGSGMASTVPDGAEAIEVRFESPPLTTPLILRRFVSRWKPDIIHAQTSGAHSHLVLAGIGGVPMVVSRRTAFKGGWNPFRRLKYGARVAHYIPISIAAAESLKARGVSESRMTVVYSGIQTGRFGSALRDYATVKRLGGGEGILLAGTAAAFEKEKGHEVLIRAASLLRPRIPGLRFLMAGEGRLEGAISKYAARLGVDAALVRIGPDMPFDAFLKAIDIYVLPSLQEGLSTGLMAAMAAGLPCVATRAGGIPEVTGEDSALLVEPGDPAGLADAVETLALDPALRERYGSRALARARRFDAASMIEGTIEVYKRAIGGFEDRQG